MLPRPALGTVFHRPGDGEEWPYDSCLSERSYVRYRNPSETELCSAVHGAATRMSLPTTLHGPLPDPWAKSAAQADLQFADAFRRLRSLRDHIHEPAIRPRTYLVCYRGSDWPALTPHPWGSQSHGDDRVRV